MRFQNLFLAAALCALAAADRARADDVYYVNNGNGTFGTVDSAGHTTTITSGPIWSLFGNAEADRLMFAPNGNLYAFDVGEGGGGTWGRINPATGAFTSIGNLNTVFPSGALDHNETYGFSLAFGSSGNLYATAYDQSSGNWDYGTLSLTNGAFTKIAASPVAYAGSLATWGNTVYYVNNGNGTFGTVDSAGHTTTITSGPIWSLFGNAEADRLMFAPNGNLYAFDVGEGGGGTWGRINPATGAFTSIGNLNTVFPSGALDHNETYGFSLAFGSSGNLYATAYDQSSGNWDYGTLSLTNGAFTKIAASPVAYAGSLVAPVPEPSMFVLLGIGTVSLLAYGWRRRAK